ncbi:sigma-70 family RNA polymerase sigma factor [Spirosoma sp. KNUC1025]|uniref:sigma-70 family RNA polymerase sigma factor n=1 Tax=Spirosoma sp. KNUC1025 TaxID=2894082 RepID=UPI0038705E2D|nr:sigma-70 family RNA polymerase sigma factor [Spirosoma sp. KNUC1025]
MDYKTSTDSTLLAYLKEGDEAAFQEIYFRHWRKLFIIAKTKLPSTESPEDFVQDLFVRLWEQRAFLLIDNLAAYLYTSLKHAIINRYKATLTQDKYVLYAQNLQASEHSTEEQIALSDLMASVEQHLNELPEKTRQIFRLNRLEYKSVREISAQLSIPERTIEYHINSALKILRPLLKDYFLIALLLWL